MPSEPHHQPAAAQIGALIGQQVRGIFQGCLDHGEPSDSLLLLVTLLLNVAEPLSDAEIANLKEASKPCGAEGCSCHEVNGSALTALITLREIASRPDATRKIKIRVNHVTSPN